MQNITTLDLIATALLLVSFTIWFINLIVFGVILSKVYEKRYCIDRSVSCTRLEYRLRIGRLGLLSLRKPGSKFHNNIMEKFKNDPFVSQYMKIPHRDLWPWRIFLITGWISCACLGGAFLIFVWLDRVHLI